MAITHPPSHAYPGMPVDLRPAGESLAEAATTPLVKQKTFEAIRLVIHKGQGLPEHQVAGARTNYCRGGRVAFNNGGKSKDMKG